MFLLYAGSLTENGSYSSFIMHISYYKRCFACDSVVVVYCMTLEAITAGFFLLCSADSHHLLLKQDIISDYCKKGNTNLPYFINSRTARSDPSAFKPASQHTNKFCDTFILGN
jgi:hypothetical protein